MAMTAPARDDLTAGCDTAAKLFRARARAWGDDPALRWKARGIWHSATWGAYYDGARAVGLALAAAGVARGEVVTVLAENRPEWLYADLGAQCMGMIGNGIYPTSSPEQVQYVLQNSGTRVLFVEDDEQLDKALAVRAQCPRLARIVVMDTEGLRGLADPMVTDFAAFLAQGRALAATRAADFEAAIDAGSPADIAFLVYTSGTTGAPKGAMIAQRNLIFQIGTVREYLTVGRGDKTLSFLPLCHIAERMATTFNQLAIGYIVHFPENAGTVMNDMREVRPHMVFAPPRFWEKMYSQVELAMRDAVAPARAVYRAALAAGRAAAEARLAGRPPADWDTARLAWLRRLAFSNIRDFLGLSEVRNAITGAAPVPPDLLKWYMAVGVDLIEGFGMTETTGFVCATPPSRIKVGFAGRSAPGVEVRLGADDEILIRGGNVFAGYWGMPEKTAEAIDADGWLATGDCGEIDADGYLAIRDRIKDIIITSGGKNITPSHIENALKFSPYIADAVVIGEARNYLTCLVMIDQDNVAKFAQDAEVPFTDFASLTRAPEVERLIAAEVEAVNARLARVEQIKTFRILSQLLTAEDEELTPTMKLKRRVIAAKYAEVIEGMYR
ncbi:MAG: long-chain fatty acid--CoA ligase [Burkholderiales bacterium]|nr:long-chain fatty acid--CoA ligase [Burkholderiales bacterium]